MDNLGQKFIYYSASQMRHGDKLRTILGRFWATGGTARIKGQPTFGYVMSSLNKERIKRTFDNYTSTQLEAEKKALEGFTGPERIKARLEYRAAMMDRQYKNDPRFVLPANWFRIRWVDRRRYDGNWLEVYRIFPSDFLAKSMAYPPQYVPYKRYGKTFHEDYKSYRRHTHQLRKGLHEYYRRGGKKLSKKESTHRFRKYGARAFVLRQMFKRLTRYINTNQPEHEDYMFDFTVPIDKVLADKMNGSLKISTASQSCQYNYFLENYEKRLGSNPNTSEAQLPNPYLVSMIDREISVPDYNREASTHLKRMIDMASLWHSIKESDVSFKVGKKDDQVLKAPRRLGRGRKKTRRSAMANSAYIEYLEAYAEKYPLLEDKWKNALERQNSNIIFGAQDYGIVQDIVAKSENCPFGTSVEFTATQTKDGDLSKHVFKSGLTSILMLKAVEHTLPQARRQDSKGDRDGLRMWNTEHPSFNTSEYDVEITSRIPRVLPKGTKFSKSGGILTYDLYSFLQMMSSATKTWHATDGLDDDTGSVSIVIDNGTELEAFSLEHSHDDRTKSKKNRTALAAFILLGQLRKLSEHHDRSWNRIIRGRDAEAKTEVIFYEIEKRRVLTNGASEVIQRFWVPNFEKQDKIKFFDAQVKYDGTYKYTIHAWTLVLGTKYQYVGMQEEGYTGIQDTNGSWQVGVVTKPIMKMMRLPYKTLEPIQVRDLPPVPPDVNIVPYRATADRLIINFNPSVDDYAQEPKVLLGTDETRFERCYRSQYGVNEAQKLALFTDEPNARYPLRFKSDDLPKTIQVFRIESAPSRWGDFSNALLTQLDVEQGETSMLDFVDSNITYYYTFRTVDIHDNVSNPTPIYKVTLVEGQGIFAEIEPYDFEKDQRLDRTFVKKITKNVQITPVFEQVVFKDDRQAESKKTIANQRKIRLGVAQDSIYGKKLKFRITSKKSGRKVDLNVSFTHKHKKPPRD